MENAPVTVFVSAKLNDPADVERYSNWVTTVFYPIWTKDPAMRIYRYRLLSKETPEYRNILSIFRFTNYRAFLQHWQSTDGKNILNDIQTTWRNKVEYIWNFPYQTERSFYAPSFTEEYEKFNKSVAIHIEAFDIPREKEGTYYSWFSDIGHDVYIARSLKWPGTIGYEHLRYTGEQNYYLDTPGFETKELGPAYVSLFHFDTLQQCLEFTNSRELAAYRAALSLYFPEGLKIKWSVDYQLVGNWKNEMASI